MNENRNFDITPCGYLYLNRGGYDYKEEPKYSKVELSSLGPHNDTYSYPIYDYKAVHDAITNYQARVLEAVEKLLKHNTDAAKKYYCFDTMAYMFHSDKVKALEDAIQAIKGVMK